VTKTDREPKISTKGAGYSAQFRDLS